MNLKDIIEYFNTPFIIIDPNEKIDYKAVQLMVKFDNRYYVGHTVHGIREDIINTNPEILDREVDHIGAIRYDPNTVMVAIKLYK